MSFTDAAAELSLTQSAVSQHVRLLEDRLGHRLFHRHARGLQLTESGKAYLPVVRDAFERLALGTGAVFGHDHETPLTLRATTGFIELWLAPRLDRLFAERPELELRVASLIWNSEFIETGVDLEVRYGQGEWVGLEAERLSRETLFPVCSPAVAARIAGDPARLADERLLHIDGFRNGWTEWLHHAGASVRIAGRGGCHFDTTLTAVHLAIAGLGVVLGRSSLVSGALARGELIAPFDSVLDTEEAFYVVWPADAPLRPQARILLEWLRREAGEPLPGATP